MSDTPEVDGPVRLDDQLCFALYTAARAVTNAYREGLSALGLTYPQYVTLLALWERDGVGVGELGGRLHLDSGTLSPLLKRLEACGLIERRRSAKDERRVLIHLTEAGNAMRGPVAQVQCEAAAHVGLAPDEIAVLRGLARRLTDTVQE